jgi:hypothetical protein
MFATHAMGDRIVSPGRFTKRLAVRETGPAAVPPPRLLDRVREAIRARHYSPRTEKAYVHWIKRYIFFHGKRHPVEMSAVEVTAFLTSLAVHDKVAASTQSQALHALLFLYRELLGIESRGSTRSSGPGGRSICPSSSRVRRCAPSSSDSTVCHASWPSSCTARDFACWNAVVCA